MVNASKIVPPLKAAKRILALLWASSRKWAVLGAVAIVAEIVFGLLTLYLIKGLVDAVTATSAAASPGQVDIEPVVHAVILTAACSLVYLLARALSGFVREAQGLHLSDHVNGMIQAHSIRLDLSFFESSRYFDTLQRARTSGGQRPAQVASNILMLAKNSLLLAGAVALLGSVNGLVLLILAVVLAPALLVRLHFTRKMYDWRRRRTQIEREAAYLDWLITSDVHAKELRIGVLGGFFQRQYMRLREMVRTEQLGIGRRRVGSESLVAMLATVAFFGALGYLAFQTAQGRHSMGDLALFLVVFQRVQSIGQELVQQSSQLYEDTLYLGQLFEYFDIRPVLQEPAVPAVLPAPAATHLRLEQVDFTYPGTQKQVLHGIDLEIPPGRIVALVGANGSGKTSLIKLMCRLYEPSAGRITLDGRDIREFGLAEYRRVFSVIFQDFARYASTVNENIRFGDIHLPADSPRIREAAIKAEADGFIQLMTQGYDTRLTRMFDGGAELSHGQWQRLALARAFAAGSRVLVLDEPTSALDPAVEFDLFRDFRALIGERSALVISHRLSTIRQADFIYVLDEGVIREAGSHDELMAKGGTYAQLFQKQAYFYRSGDGSGGGPSAGVSGFAPEP
jgi:ATP-binding cassette subfamily B protein